MNRAKKSKRSATAERDPPSGNQAGSRDTPGPQQTVDDSAGASMPPVSVRNVISIWLPIHLFTLLVSYSAVVEPSSIHARVQSLLRPYLQVTHFGADDRPLYLAYGEESEQPHRLEVTESEIGQLDANVRWTNPHFDSADPTRLTLVEGSSARPGMSVSDRYHRWLATAATLADNDQSSLVAELLAPVVRSIPKARAVRIVRIPTDMNTTIADQLPPPYVARVIRDGDRISLIRLRADRLSAVANGTEP